MQDLRGRDQPGHHATCAESYLASWKASEIPDQVNQLLATTEDSEDDANVNTDVNTQTVQAPSLSWGLPEQLVSEESTQAGGDLSHTRPVIDHSMAAANANTITIAPFHYSLPFQHFVLPPGSRRLLARYFSYTHCWIPIVERHAIFESFYSYPDEGFLLTRQSPDSGKHAVLWAIFACGSVDLSWVGAPVSENTTNGVSETLYASARSLIPWESEQSFSRYHVQALTILALYRWIQHDYKASWLLVSQAISVAFALDLDQPSAAENHLNSPIERIWLGCFCLETLLAIRLRRRPQLKSRDVESFLPLQETGVEEWEPWQACDSNSNALPFQHTDHNPPCRTLSTFHQLMRLLCIANDAMQTPRAYTQPHQIALLQAWTQQTPSHCKQIDTRDGQKGSAQILTPSVANLQFVYQALVVRTCRECMHDVRGDCTLRIATFDFHRFARFIGQIHDADYLHMLPPSLDILTNAISEAQELPSLYRGTDLRQLQCNLTTLGTRLSSHGTELNRTNPCGSLGDINDIIIAEELSDRHGLSDSLTLDSDVVTIPEQTASSQLVSDLVTPVPVALDTHEKGKRGLESPYIIDGSNQSLEEPRESHQSGLAQQYRHEMPISTDANLGCQGRQESVGDNYSLEFLITPSMTDGPSIFDCVEPLDEIDTYILHVLVANLANL